MMMMSAWVGRADEGGEALASTAFLTCMAQYVPPDNGIP